MLVAAAAGVAAVVSVAFAVGKCAAAVAAVIVISCIVGHIELPRRLLLLQLLVSLADDDYIEMQREAQHELLHLKQFEPVGGDSE